MTRKPSHSPARPRRLPPAAPLPSALQTIACRLRPLEYLEWCRRRLGRRFTVRPLDMPPLVFLSDPNDIRAVVTAPMTVLHSGVGAALTAPLFGETSFMLLLEERERKNRRDTIMPAFHRQAIAEHADMVTELASREVASWSLDTPTPLHPRLCHLSLAVMLKTVFGNDDPLLPMLHQQMLAMLSVTDGPVLQQPRLHCLPGWRRTWARFTRDREQVDSLIAGIIATRRRLPEKNGDMLDLLLDGRRLDGSPMTATELRDNLVAVIIAGSETTASALAWAIQLIAHYPRVQDRLIAELDADDGEDYLEATVNETLRHRPVFLFSAPRAVSAPIEIGGWTYNPPAHLLASIYLMHHDPALFAEPQAFRPERFLDSRPAAWTWLPWGGGMQRCPGRHLALLELRTVLRTAFATLRVLPASATVERARWRSVIVTPHAGCTVVLRKRSNRSARPAGVGLAGRHSGFF